MRRTLLALVAILPLEAATSQDRGVVRDSAGIQVVTHRESAVAPVYALQPTRVVIGTEAGAELTRVVGALRMPDERIVVLDGGRRQLLRFLPSGALESAIGREGSGPGEFTGPRWLARYGRDSIAAYDFRQVRFSIYGDSGFVRQGLLLRNEHMNMMEMTLAGILPNGTPVMASGASTELAAQGPPRIERLVVPLVTYRSDGKPGALLGRFPGRELQVSSIEEGPRAGGFRNGVRLFGLDAAFAVAGNHLIVTDTRTFGFDVLDAAGKIVRRVRRESDAQNVQQAHKAAYIAERVAAVREDRRAQMRDDLQKEPHALVFPAISSQIVIDAENRIWLGSYKRPGDVEQSWWCFTVEGDLVGRVTVPTALTVTDAGPNYVLGIRQDADGVQTVRLYDLVRRP